MPAVNEYEVAAHMDPSEGNLFDWGERAASPPHVRARDRGFRAGYAALSQFASGAASGWGWRCIRGANTMRQSRPCSAAADLNPADPRCYLFLSKAYDSSPNQADDVIQRFRRFAELQPSNALALYYYAMSLWKGKRAEDPGLILQEIESLLQKSIALDPEACPKPTCNWAISTPISVNMPSPSRSMKAP